MDEVSAKIMHLLDAAHVEPCEVWDDISWYTVYQDEALRYVVRVSEAGHLTGWMGKYHGRIAP